jgi:quinol monooxygenase YgiN
MYGLIGKMIAAPGRRDDLIAILVGATGAMPGCRSYIVARDVADRDAIWIAEVWDDEAAHKGSLSLPEVHEAIARARPMIAGFGERIVTEPVGREDIPSR